jgi:small subunit ribosomal protein S17
MADEEKNEQETPEAAEEGAEQAGSESAEAAPAEEPAAKAAEGAAAEPEAGGEEEPEALSPKQVRKRARSVHGGEALPQRAAPERASERAAARKQKADARRRYRANRRSRKGEAQAGTPPAEPEPGPKKLRQGVVTSSKGDKTITVEVESARRHPTYEKIVRRSKSLRAHDEHNEAGEGDTVRLVETRPISKTKRWRLVEVIEKAR